MAQGRCHGSHRGLLCTVLPATPYLDGAAEDFRGRIEDKFHSLENLLNAPDLRSKALAHMLCFKLERPSLNRKRTPFQMAQQQTRIQDPHFMTFPPLVLNRLPPFGPTPPLCITCIRRPHDGTARPERTFAPSLQIDTTSRRCSRLARSGAT